MVAVNKQLQDNLDIIQGNAPLVLTGGGQGTASGSPTQTQTQTVPAQPTPSQAGPLTQSTQAQPSTGSLGGGIQQNILSQPSSILSRFTGTLGAEQSSTQQAQGPSRTFESIGAADTLTQAVPTLGTPEPSAAQTQAAKDLVGAQFSGPPGLDPEGLKEVTALGTQLSPFAGALTSPGGLQTLVQQTAPQLTPGQARFESQLLSRDPEFQAQASQTANEIERALSTLPLAQQQATQFAQQRGQEERDISQQSIDFLTGFRDPASADIQAEVERKQAELTAREEAARTFGETGDIEALKDFVDISPFQTEGQATIDEANRVFDEIIGGDFPFTQKEKKKLRNLTNKLAANPQAATAEDANQLLDLASLADKQAVAATGDAKQQKAEEKIEKFINKLELDTRGELPGEFVTVADPDGSGEVQVPPLFTSLNSRGRETFKLHPLYKDLLKEEGLTNKEIKTLKGRLINRQRVLETMFSPKTKEVRQEGKFALERPLFNVAKTTVKGEDISLSPLELADPKNFIEFSMGITPTRENVPGVDEQRQIFNAVNEIIGAQDRINAPSEPFRDAVWETSVEGFISKNEEILENQRGELDESSKLWKGFVKRMRDKFEDAVKRKKRNDAIAITSLVAPLVIPQTGPVTDLTAPGPANIETVPVSTPGTGGNQPGGGNV